MWVVYKVLVARYREIGGQLQEGWGHELVWWKDKWKIRRGSDTREGNWYEVVLCSIMFL